MTNCLFVSDLHGDIERYKKLFRIIAAEKPEAVFLGGDILPSVGNPACPDFIKDFLVEQLNLLNDELSNSCTRVFVILGNDDGRHEEAAIQHAASQGVWEYIHGKRERFKQWPVYGYSYIPPSPFRLKDWERYDVSRFIDPGCVSPEEGVHSIPVSKDALRYSTIREDLQILAGSDDMENAVFLFHSPPYNTKLDRAALDGKMIDHVPLDVHVGSIAVRRFIETHQPLLTLHGHVHESTRITGSWRDRIGRTHLFSAAHEGPELALVRFDLEDPGSATRELI